MDYACTQWASTTHVADYSPKKT